MTTSRSSSAARPGWLGWPVHERDSADNTVLLKAADKDINLLSGRASDREGGSVRNAIRHNSRALSGKYNTFIMSPWVDDGGAVHAGGRGRWDKESRT